MSPPRLTRRRIVVVLALLGTALLAGAAVALSIGSASVPLPTLLRALAGASVPPEVETILIQVRLARILLAALTGAALACAGTAFQAVLRNPLADPYILGISGGAAVGAILVSLGGVAGPAWARPAAAFAGACLTVLAILSLSRSRGVSPSTPMLLIGWIFNSFFLALILFLETAVDFSRIRGAIFWLVGTLAPERYSVLGVLAGIVATGIAALWLLARDFNLLCAGEESARTLGCNVERTRLLGILAASLITASVVAFGGLIGFVGLIVPHAARYLFGPDHRLLLPASALLGATGLVLADAVSRTLLAPTEVPVGVLTVLVGGPIFILLYRRHRGEVAID
ncbi:MAG TPA: iron ABC transporter permease [Candidatus Polarisedimenticolia bacterium]|nr:iron ABC transporter permease [Candidatus Polarisedimenticolia bacterium]